MEWEQEEKPLWIMQDFTGQEIANFVTATEQEAKTGRVYKRLEFTNPEHEQIFVTGFKSNATGAVKLYGKETKKWKDKQFKLYVKNKIVQIEPIEEEIKE